MIDRIRRLFVERAARPEGGDERHSAGERHLAAAALLVHAACVDAEFDEAERVLILDLAQRRFGLGDEEAQELLAAAETAVGDSVQLLGFTRAVKDGFSYEERVELIEMLWEVVHVDGRLDAYESQLMRRIGGLIYVTDRDRGLARKRVLERLASPDN